MAVIGKDYLACNYARRRGTCSNRVSVKRSSIETVILDALKTQLMAPQHVEEFIRTYHQEVNRHRQAQDVERRDAIRG